MTISRQDMVTLLGGILSGGFFSLMAYSPGGGLLSLFLPSLPLALLGFCFSAKQAVLAAFAACVITGVFIGGEAVLFFVLFLAFPICHFVRKALLWRGEDGDRAWYPILTILAHLFVLASGLFMVFALSVNHPESADLKTMLSKMFIAQMGDQLSRLEPEAADAMKILATDWLFMMFAGAAWVWGLMIYLFCVLANMLLKSNRLALRPSLALTEEGLPLWLPVVMLVSVGLALFGQGNDKFAGEVVLTILLMPYFLCGIASLNTFSLRWNNRGLWLTVIYGMLVLIPWFSVLFIARGMHVQLETALRGIKSVEDDN